VKNSDSNPNALELAKQGSPKAIADLLNGQLQPKGITAIVTKDRYFDREERLKIVFEYEQAKSKEKILLFTKKFFQQLNPQSIVIVMIYGRKAGNDAADWRDEIKLNNTIILENLKKSEAEVEIGNDSNQISSLSDRVKLNLLKASDFVANNDFENAKLAAEEFLLDVAKNDKKLGWSEHKKIEYLMQALYIKAVCHAYIESIESTLDILYYALEMASELPSELDIINTIKDLTESCERVEDKSVTLISKSPSLKNDDIKAIDKEIDNPKKKSKGIDFSLKIPKIGVDWIPAGIAFVLYLPLLLLLLVPVIFFGIILVSNPVGWVIIVLLIIYFIGQQNG